MIDNKTSRAVETKSEFTPEEMKAIREKFKVIEAALRKIESLDEGAQPSNRDYDDDDFDTHAGGQFHAYGHTAAIARQALAFDPLSP